jgi:4-amino-4-deoxy-L-arabinose transferase-like glycosyltransferase
MNAMPAPSKLAAPPADADALTGNGAGSGEPLAGRDSLRPFAFVLLIAFLVRAGVFVVVLSEADPKVYRSPDTAHYLALARALDAGGRFATGEDPEIARTPGYPLLLAFTRRFGEVEVTTVSVQLLLSLATVALVYVIGRQLAGPAAGVAAAGLYAFDVLSIVYVNKLLSETLFTFLVAAFAAALVRHLRARGWASLVVAAIAVAAAAYVRPIAYFLVPLVGLCLVVRGAFRRGHRARGIAQGAAFLVLAGVAVGAWQVRNYRVADYAGWSAIADTNLYFYQAAAIRAKKAGRPFYEVQREMGHLDERTYLRQHTEQYEWTLGERRAFQRQRGIEAILNNPGIYAAIHAKGMLRVLLDPGSVEALRVLGRYPASGGLLGKIVDRGLAAAMRELRTERPLVFWASVVLGAWLLAYLLAAAVGLRPQEGVPWSLVATVALLAAYFWILSGGPHSEGRFRHPMMPLICVLAGLALTRRRRSNQPATRTTNDAGNPHQ